MFGGLLFKFSDCLYGAIFWFQWRMRIPIPHVPIPIAPLAQPMYNFNWANGAMRFDWCSVRGITDVNPCNQCDQEITTLKLPWSANRFLFVNTAKSTWLSLMQCNRTLQTKQKNSLVNRMYILSSCYLYIAFTAFTETKSVYDSIFYIGCN